MYFYTNIIIIIIIIIIFVFEYKQKKYWEPKASTASDSY